MTFNETYAKGIRRLLFVSDDKGQRVSVLKALLLVSYILGMTLLFVQFATVASEDMVVTVTFTGTDVLNPENQVIYSADEFFNEIKTELEQEYEKGEYIVNYNIRLNIFGNIAATLNFFILIGFLLFLTAEFIPLNKMMIEQRVKDFASQTTRHLLVTVIAIVLVIILILGTLYGLFVGLVLTGEFITVFRALSIDAGNGAFYPWLVLQPILLFGGLLVVFDLITSDFDLGKRFGKKTIIFLVIELLFVILSFIFLFTLIKNLIPQIKDGVATTYKIEGLEWINISNDGLYNLCVGILGLVLVVTSIILGIFIIERVFDKKKKVVLLITVCGIIPSFIYLFVEFLLHTQFAGYQDTNLEVVIILLVILIVIFYRKQSSEEKAFLAQKKPLIPLLLLFGLVMVMIKTIPALFLLEGRLKALTNIFDIVGFLAILLLSIFRVVTLPDTTSSSKLEGKTRFNPIEWWKRIPIYSKTLFFFYLSFVAFFLSLESYTVASILSSIQNVPIQSEIQITRLNILAATAALGLIYVFFRYKPIPKTTTPGPLKVFLDQTKEKFKEIDDSILRKADFLDHEDRILKEDSGEN
jgi:hypothetical protein